ncbi:hypothetical protein HK098_000213 [Nowakowskiella sp. JEL0407]|nr:hypothetical protein HK098_000213 [Nowakowskiella sp. JEL0407]
MQKVNHGTWVNKRPEALSNGMALPRTLISHAAIPPDLSRPRAQTHPEFYTNLPLNANGLIPPPLTNAASPRSSISSLSSLNSSVSSRLVYGIDGLPYIVSNPPQFDGSEDYYFPSANDIEETSAMEIFRTKQLMSQKLSIHIPNSTSEENHGRMRTHEQLSSRYYADLQPLSPSYQPSIPTGNTRRVSFINTVMVAKTWSSYDYDRTPIKVEPLTESDLLEFSNPLVLHYLLERSGLVAFRETHFFSPPPTISEIPYETSKARITLKSGVSPLAKDKLYPVGYERKEAREKNRIELSKLPTAPVETNLDPFFQFNAFSPVINPPTSTTQHNLISQFNSMLPHSPAPDSILAKSTKSHNATNSTFEQPIKQISILKRPPIPTRNSYNINPNHNASISNLNLPSAMKKSANESKSIMKEDLKPKESRLLVTLSGNTPVGHGNGERKIGSGKEDKKTTSESSVIEIYSTKFESEENEEFILTPIRSQLRRTDSQKVSESGVESVNGNGEEEYDDEEETPISDEQQHQRRRRRRRRVRSRRKKYNEPETENLENDGIYDGQVHRIPV